MTTKIRWDVTDPATLALLDSLFEDMGIANLSRKSEGKAREATRQYISNYIKEACEIGSYPTMGEVNTLAFAYYDGFLAGIAKV